MRNFIKDGRRFNFTLVENEILEDEEVNTYEKLTYIILCKFANKEDTCFPSRKKLSKLVSCSIKTIDRTIKSMVEKGLIIKHKRKNDKGDHTSNLYIIKGVASESRQGGRDTESPPGDTESPELDSFNNIKTEEEESKSFPQQKKEKIPDNVNHKFSQIFNRTLSNEFYKKLTDLYSDEKIILKALKIAELNADKPSYLIKVLQDWENNGLTSVTEINTYIGNRQAQKEVRNSRSKTSVSKIETSKEELKRLYETGWQ